MEHGRCDPYTHTYDPCLQNLILIIVSHIEKTYRQEITELKKDLGVRMEDIEGTTDGICNTLQSHEETLNSLTVLLQQHMYHQDDNREP